LEVGRTVVRFWFWVSRYSLAICLGEPKMDITRIIKCPKCSNAITVYHMEWSAMSCPGCNAFIDNPDIFNWRNLKKEFVIGAIAGVSFVLFSMLVKWIIT
jgi:hypothetical protein